MQIYGVAYAKTEHNAIDDDLACDATVTVNGMA